MKNSIFSSNSVQEPYGERPIVNTIGRIVINYSSFTHLWYLLLQVTHHGEEHNSHIHEVLLDFIDSVSLRQVRVRTHGSRTSTRDMSMEVDETTPLSRRNKVVRKARKKQRKLRSAG